MLTKRSSLCGPVAIAVTLAATGTLASVGLGTAASAAVDATAAAATVQVSPTPAQTIQNIGASGAWWVNDLTHFAPATQQRVAQLLFSSSGIQLSAYRYNIGGGGVGVTGDRSRAPQTLLVSPGSYDWNRDPGGTTFLKYAAQYGVPDIIGFVNSAPTVWTTSGKSCGGSLKSSDEQAYATYLADIVTHFNAEGVKIDYISPMNEPASSFSACNQEGMAVSDSQRGAIVRAVGQTLAARAPYAHVSADESDHVSRFLTDVPQWITQPGTAQYVANLAHHTYDFPSDSTLAQIPVMAKKYGKPTWASELCCMTSVTSPSYGAQYDPTITGGLAMASMIYRDFSVSQDSAFHWWTALSKVMGCNPANNPSCATSVNGSGYNDGLIYFDPNYASDGNQNLYITKRFYALGQYSKFVRPGSVRYPVTGAPSGVQITATSLGGDWTLVVNNLNNSTQAVNVHLPAAGITASSAYRTSASENLSPIALPTVSAGTAALSLPAHSIATYVFAKGGTPPTTTPPTTAPPTTASPTTNPPTTPSPTGSSACSVAYSIASQWPGGFQGNVTITDNSARAIDGWVLTWTFADGQQVTQGWNGSFSQAGNAVTVTNASWNGSIAAGASASVGFQASLTGSSNHQPTDFALNGVACTAS